MPTFGELKKVTYTKNEKDGPKKHGKLIFHIYRDGVYCPYYVNKVHKCTLALKCACKKCTAIFTIESPFNHRIGEYNTSGKKKSKFAVRLDIPEAELLDHTKYGVPIHDCKRPHCPKFENCTKPDHLEICTQKSRHPTWNKRLISSLLKRKRKIDKITPSAALVQQIIAPFLPQVPIHTLSSTYLVENGINLRSARQVVYNIDKTDKLTTKRFKCK